MSVFLLAKTLLTAGIMRREGGTVMTIAIFKVLIYTEFNTNMKGTEMSWKISDEEFTAVLKLKEINRYEYFIKKVSDWEELWSLSNNEGWVLASDNQGRYFIPVWPHHRYAQACAQGVWEDCQPKSIELDSWLERWIPGMMNDHRIISVFPTPNNKGYLVEPDKMEVDLMTECENYD